MITTIDNSLRVFQVITSRGAQYFCNLDQLNEVVRLNGLMPGYFKIYHFWNNKPAKCSKKYLRDLFAANQLKMEFHY
jgi:hypothetical protein